RLDMLDAVQLVEGRAFHGILDRPELRSVDRPVRGKLHAHGVGAADVADGGAKEVRTRRDGPADQDSARARAGAREVLGARVALLHEVFRAGYEILPRVGLGRLVARLVPGFALLSSTPPMRVGQ